MRNFIYFCIIGTLIMGCEGQNAQTEQPGTDIARYGSLIKVKKEFEERYIILHRNTFPGVLDRIHKSNIRNYSIFIDKGLLFSHFEYIGANFKYDMDQMADPVTKDWWKLTDPMQEPLESRKKGEWWASIDLLYQMDTSKVAYENARRVVFVGNVKSDQKERFKSKLNTIDIAMVQNFLKYNFQNLTIYSHDSLIYIYLEYVGNKYQMELEQLLEETKIKDLYRHLTALMDPPLDSDQSWLEMTEIFHTN